MYKVSIIVPCYNQAQYLPETIESVLSQTYKNWECIIINDGSTDNSEEIAKLYCESDRRVHYIYQTNGGLSSARNTGIRHSCGELILPLDADDLIGNSYIEQAVNRFMYHPETSLVYCLADRFGAINAPLILPDYSYETLIWQNCFFCTSMFRRIDYDKTNGYNTNMVYGWEDWDFWISLLNPQSKVYRIDEVLFHYRARIGSMLSSSNQHNEYLCKQLYLNHRDVYDQYLPNIVYYAYNMNNWKELYEM